MGNRISRHTDDRRTSDRLPIGQDIRYKVLGIGARKRVNQVGRGKTLNMSSGGVFFTTESALPEGERIELTVSWPWSVPKKRKRQLPSRDTSSRRSAPAASNQASLFAGCSVRRPQNRARLLPRGFLHDGR